MNITGPATEALRKQLAALSDSWSRSISRSLGRYVEAASLQLPSRVFTDQLSRIFSDEVREVLRRAAQTMREAFARALPDNWSGFDIDEAFAVVDVMKATGLCLVWTPRQDIVREILDDPHKSAFRIIERRRGDILSDLEQCLGDVRHAELAGLRDAARESIEAERAGFHQCAQALSASVLTSIIHGPLQAKRIKDAHDEFAEAHPEDAGIDQLRLRAIYVSAEATLPSYNPVDDRPPHGRFNRHNTAHRVTATQFTPRNSLAALMLIVPFLRELDYWLSRLEAEDSDVAA